jgi:hypothetical protein
MRRKVQLCFQFFVLDDSTDEMSLSEPIKKHAGSLHNYHPAGLQFPVAFEYQQIAPGLE